METTLFVFWVLCGGSDWFALESVVAVMLSVVFVVSVGTAPERPQLASPFIVIVEDVAVASICMESRDVEGLDDGGASETESIDMFWSDSSSKSP